ncbi:MAG: hypothetical protein U0441_22620 [Polyangiaceae bacterium]
MTLAIVGSGLVSPTGTNAVQHVMFLRAGAPPPPVSPFLLSDDRRLRVFYCPWLGARAKIADRLLGLANAAADEALAPLTSREMAFRPHLILCTGAPRPGLSPGDVDALEEALRRRLQPSSVERISGDAGTFVALKRLRTAPVRPEPTLLLAVDSMISLDTLTDIVVHPHSPWQRRPPHPSEAAAALLLWDEVHARRAGVPALGFVDGAETATDPANDDNDETVEGTALTEVVHKLPVRGPIALVFGQSDVDSFRIQDWVIASARNHARLRPDCEMVCLEADAGRIGGASGAASIVYGLTMIRHGAAPRQAPKDTPFVAWATSPDGLRGACAVRCA